MAKPPFIIDAGPAINFLASGHERLLTNAIGRQAVYAPQTVEDEVLRKSRKIIKFKGAARRWRNMQPNWLHLLSDDSQDPALRSASYALLSTPLEVRQEDGDDIGETMVVLHAYARAMVGETVVVIIDDAKGRQFAKKAQEHVNRARQNDPTIGHISQTSTVTLIGQRINTPDIPNHTTLATFWAEITRMDDGLPAELPPSLSAHPRWNGPQRR